MNTENNSDIINNYQNIYTYSKRYMMLVLSIIIWIWWYILMNSFYSKQILLQNNINSGDILSSTWQIVKIKELDNPFVLQKIWGEDWIVLPKNEQRISSDVQENNFDANDFVIKYIYKDSNNSWINLENHINTNANSNESGNSIDINNDIVKYFNLSCLFVQNPVDLSQSKLCQENLKIFVNTFPNYKIEDDLWWFEKVVNKWISWYKEEICKNILQYVYAKWKIYANFDTTIQSCPNEKKNYNKIIDLKKFMRDEKETYNNKKYENIDVNQLKLVSRMQSIYNQVNQEKIDLVQVKQYINRISSKSYINNINYKKLQSIIYILNNKIKENISTYISKNSISTEDLWYANKIMSDIDEINTSLGINTWNINTWTINTNTETWENNYTWENKEIINTWSNDEVLYINELLHKYIIWSSVDEYKLISKDKYLYKISIWNTKRWFLVIKNTQNIWMMKTLFIGKSNGIYTKVNDFSVDLDDSEQKRFDAFMSKYQEIYKNLNK